MGGSLGPDQVGTGQSGPDGGRGTGGKIVGWGKMVGWGTGGWGGGTGWGWGSRQGMGFQTRDGVPDMGWSSGLEMGF